MIYDLYHYFSNLPRWHIFAVFLFGYSVYYLIEVVKVSNLATSIMSPIDNVHVCFFCRWIFSDQFWLSEMALSNRICWKMCRRLSRNSGRHFGASKVGHKPFLLVCCVSKFCRLWITAGEFKEKTLSRKFFQIVLSIFQRDFIVERRRRSCTGLDGSRLQRWFTSCTTFARSHWRIAIRVHKMLGNGRLWYWRSCCCIQQPRSWRCSTESNQ